MPWVCVCVYERGVCPCRACATCGRNRARLGADNCHQWCKETVLFPSDLLLFLFLKKLNWNRNKMRARASSCLPLVVNGVNLTGSRCVLSDHEKKEMNPAEPKLKTNNMDKLLMISVSYQCARTYLFNLVKNCWNFSKMLNETRYNITMMVRNE